MENILLTGYRGQLGTDIVNELNKRGINYIGCDVDNLDITDNDAVINFFKNNNITRVIHTAGYTAVDKAEECPDICRKVNADGTKNIVEQCKKYDIPLMYFSTDYVFGGEGDVAFKEDDKTNPLGVYAKTKYEGEVYARELDKYFILRISWVFGANGKNFIDTMMKLSETHSELNVVCDQIGSPTYTVDLAKLVCDMILTEKYGTYHATNEGYTSWADFARLIFKNANKNVKVNDVTTEEYNAKALRPKNSRLDKSKLEKSGFNRLPDYKDALVRYMKLKNYIK